MNDILILIKNNYSIDEVGNQKPTQIRRKVFAEEMSVGQGEFFNGVANGIRPSCKFKMWRNEYGGETVCEYQGREMQIYRTFAKNDHIEIYCTEVTANVN